MSDDWKHLRHCAYEAIAAARLRLGNKYHWENSDPEFQEIERLIAEDFLEEIAKEARARGKKPGDTASAAENRRALDALTALIGGKQLKQVAFQGQGTQKDHEKRTAALSKQVSRFSNRAYAKVKHFFRRQSRTDPAKISGAYIKMIFADLPGTQFPEDIPAFKEALRRAASSAQKP